MTYTFHNWIGIPLGTAWMYYEDWYNYCTAGNVYVRPSCTIDLVGAWVCNAPVYGQYYDGGINQQVDWDNQEFTQTIGGLITSCEIDFTHYTAANPNHDTYDATIRDGC
ncbi:MAG: hypothetical protein ACRDHP_05495 [Ktedonobacterales bacterium]